MWLVHLCCVIASFLVNMLFLKIKSRLFVIRMFFPTCSRCTCLEELELKCLTMILDRKNSCISLGTIDTPKQASSPTRAAAVSHPRRATVHASAPTRSGLEHRHLRLRAMHRTFIICETLPFTQPAVDSSTRSRVCHHTDRVRSACTVSGPNARGRVLLSS
jgi:hypothetical protein